MHCTVHDMYKLCYVFLSISHRNGYSTVLTDIIKRFVQKLKLTATRSALTPTSVLRIEEGSGDSI